MVKLYGLQYCANGEAHEATFKKVMDGLLRIFRKAIAEEGFTAGPIKLKNTDLNRVHGIVNEIDSRRVFYNIFEDESPISARISVHETRAVLRLAAKGIWASSSEERIIQEIQRALADFETACDKIKPFPRRDGDSKFDEFVVVIAEMRIKVWSLIAYLKQKNGDVIRPLNMPREIITAVLNSGLP